MADVYLSPTSVIRHETCPAQQQFYRQGWRVDYLSDTLHFGNSAHQALEAFHMADPYGGTVDLPQRFTEAFLEPTRTTTVRYGNGRDKESLLETGLVLMGLYPQAWQQTGFHALIDGAGPLVERKYRVRIAGAGVVLVAKIDVAVLDDSGRVILIDHKTPGQDHDPDFTARSDQILAYQAIFEAHADEHGVDRIDGVGIHPLVRRKVSTTGRGKGPTVNPPDIIERRSDTDVALYLEKVCDIASDIRAGRAHKRPLHEHNSPCTMCDYARACQYGDFTDLVNIKSPPNAKAEENHLAVA